MIYILFILLPVALIASFTCGWYLRERWAELAEPTKKRRARHSENEEELAEKQETIKELRTENKRLATKVAELEQLLYCNDCISMKSAPKLVDTIFTKASERNKSSVTGITFLENNLYVVSSRSPEIEVYDSKTFNFESVIENCLLVNPFDIASSRSDKCLYVIDRADLNSKSEILKLDLSGKSGKKWAIENDYGRLSTYESNLVVCFSTKRVINEYSPDGERLNTIRLSPADGFRYLWHAIKLTGTNFAVSHMKAEDDRQRICVVDVNGVVLKAIEELPKFMLKMNFPMCLAEYRDKSVLVADNKGSRILLLSSNMKFHRIFVETRSSLTPVRLCLNEARDRLFVALNHYNSSQRTWNDGRIFVYKIT